MLGSLKISARVAHREWRLFLGSKKLLIWGIAVPTAIAIALMLVVSFLPKNMPEGINRWEYFKSELKTFVHEVKGTYDFETSLDRKLFYVVDDTEERISTVVQAEVLKRDLTDLIEYLRRTPFAEWEWFDEPEDGELSSPRQLWSAIAKDDFTAEELISQYLLEHDDTFSSRLSTLDTRHSWFVQGWNENIEDIVQKIPQMTFAHYVQVNVRKEEWLRSGWITGYFKFPSDFLDSLRGQFYDIDTPLHALKGYRVDYTATLRNWYERILDYVVVHSFPRSEDVITNASQGDSIAIGHERSHELNKRLDSRSWTHFWSGLSYTLLFLLAVIGNWRVLYLDPHLKETGEKSAPAGVMDGRVLGATLVIATVVALWFILLLIPVSVLLGTQPIFGGGALATFFHPLFLFNYLLFFVLGLLSCGYLFHVHSLTRVSWFSFTMILVMWAFAINAATLSDSKMYFVIMFLPLAGPIAMLKHTAGYPDLMTYVVFVLVAVVHLIGLRILMRWVEKLYVSRNDLKFSYQPT